jgi:uncharacterized delta-60 repeat protein
LAVLAPAGAHAAGPGAVDVSFGQAGQASGEIGGGNTILDGGMVQQADGGIVTAGTYTVERRGAMLPGQRFAAIARFTRDGQTDRDFGTRGWTLDDRYQVTGPPVQQRDGKIVVPGGRMGADGIAVATVARYERDGSVDRDFGDEGLVALDLRLPWAFAPGAAIDREGRIVLAVQGQEALTSPGMRFGVARLTPGGKLDRDFGDGGLALVDPSVGDRDTGAIALLPDGDVVVAGETRGQGNALMARFDSAGRPARSWGDGGVVDVGFPGVPGELSVDRDDHVVLVTGIGTPPFPRSAVVMRFGRDGERDATFGVKGVFVATIGASTDVTSSVLQPDGKRVVAGGFYKPRSGPDGTATSTTGWALMRVRADGKLDRAFGNDGRVTSPLGPSFSVARDVIQQDDGRYVAGGTSVGCDGGTITLVRYHGDSTGAGQPDPGPIVRPCPGQAPVDTTGIELTIACPLVELTCEGDIVLDVPLSQYLEQPAGASAARTVRVASRHYRMSGNRRLTTPVKLSTRGKRLVRRGRSFRATATIVSRDRRGKRRVSRTRVTVTPKG